MHHVRADARRTSTHATALAEVALNYEGVDRTSFYTNRDGGPTLCGCRARCAEHGSQSRRAAVLDEDQQRATPISRRPVSDDVLFKRHLWKGCVFCVQAYAGRI